MLTHAVNQMCLILPVQLWAGGNYHEEDLSRGQMGRPIFPNRKPIYHPNCDDVIRRMRSAEALSLAAELMMWCVHLSDHYMNTRGQRRTSNGAANTTNYKQQWNE